MGRRAGDAPAAEGIEAVARAAKGHGAGSFWASTLRLASLVKEHYLGFVGAAHPGLLPHYERAYPGANAPREYLAGMATWVEAIRARHGFLDDSTRRPRLVGSSARDAVVGTGSLQLGLPLGDTARS